MFGLVGVGVGLPFSSFLVYWGNLSGFLEGWVAVNAGGAVMFLLVPIEKGSKFDNRVRRIKEI